MKQKISILNILTPFLFIVIFLFTAPYIGTVLLGNNIWNFFCNYLTPNMDYCTPIINSYNDTPYIWGIIFFILPSWIFVGIIWFYIIRYIIKKMKNKWKFI